MTQSVTVRRNFARVALLALCLAVGAIGYAQTDPSTAAEQAFTDINTSVCAFVSVMRSGFTYAIVIAAIVIGGIMKAAGSRAGIPVIVGALIGGFIVLIAPSVASVIFPTATAADCTT